MDTRHTTRKDTTPMFVRPSVFWSVRYDMVYIFAVSMLLVGNTLKDRRINEYNREK